MVLPVTPSLFAQDIGRAARKKQQKDKPKGFFGSVGEALVKGFATELGSQTASQLISKPLEAYNTSQKEKADAFLETESIVQAKRNNALQNSFLSSYRNAINRSKNNNTDSDVELAKENFIVQPTLEAFRNKQFVREGKTDAFTDQEILDLTADIRLAEVKKNRAKFDDIYTKAKGIRSPEAFTKFLETQGLQTKGLLLDTASNLKNLLKKKSPAELAEARILNDPRYLNTLEGLNALESYRNTNDEGTLVTAIRNIKLKDIPSAYYLQTETDIEEKALGGGNYAKFLKKKVINNLANTVDSSSTMVPGSERFGLTIADRLTDIRKLIKDNNMSDEIVPDFSVRAEEIINNKFKNGVMSNTGERKPYNYLRPQDYATAEGEQANRLLVNEVYKLTFDPRSFVDQNKENALRAQKQLELRLEFMKTLDAVKDNYSGRVKVVENKNGKPVLGVFKGNKLLVPDENGSYGDEQLYAEKVIQGYEDNQNELAFLHNHLVKAEERTRAIRLGLISVIKAKVPVTIDNKTIIQEIEVAAPPGAIGINPDATGGLSDPTSFTYPVETTKEFRNNSARKFRLYKKGRTDETTEEINEMKLNNANKFYGEGGEKTEGETEVESKKIDKSVNVTKFPTEPVDKFAKYTYSDKPAVTISLEEFRKYSKQNAKRIPPRIVKGVRIPEKFESRIAGPNDFTKYKSVLKNGKPFIEFYPPQDIEPEPQDIKPERIASN